MSEISELKRLAEAHVQKDIVDPIESTRVMLVEPKTVLALIAENDVLTEIFNDAPDLPDTDVEWLEKTRALEGERDRLRAEVAGLKTGYEAYERVNAELKAENETLIAAAQALPDEWRKDQADAKRYQWLRDSSQYDWDVSYGKLELRIETPHVDSSDLDACIDAAMCQGEQS